MAVTKILARSGGVKQAIQYVLNGDKTERQILTAAQGCRPSTAYHNMLATKQHYGKTDGVQLYHIVQSFLPGEPGKAVRYIEWLRQSRGQPTFRSMLEADLWEAIRDANDLGHFFLLMEHRGYEIKHGNRLGFRLRGQERYMIPGRTNPLFTEEGIRSAIQGNLEEIEAGLRPAVIRRPRYQSYRPHPKYTGFLALYVHYLYLLGKIARRQYPPRMTPRLRQAVMQAEQYQKQFDFLREHHITTEAELTTVQAATEQELTALTKQRTILNVRKKKRRELFDALADVEALAPARALYEEGLSGMEAEFAQYMAAVQRLDTCGIPREQLAAEKAALYRQLAEVNRQIRSERGKLALCTAIRAQAPQMAQDIQKIEKKEVHRDEHRR